jgi:ribosomal protein S18 acetylase RimI-like enzyme
VALLVDDGHQGCGIGSLLFRHLVAIARDSAIRRFVAEVLPSNERMLALFARSGLPLAKTRMEGSVHITLELNSD